MGSVELSEWYVLYRRIAPFGDEWRQSGMLAAIAANSHPFRSSDSKVFEPEDFMPLVREAVKPVTREQPIDEQLDLVRTVHKALGG